MECTRERHGFPHSLVSSAHAPTDTSARPLVRGILVVLLFALAILGTPFGCFGSVMNADHPGVLIDYKAFTALSLFAAAVAIELMRKSTWARGSAALFTVGVVGLGVLLARHTTSTRGSAWLGHLYVVSFFLAIGGAFYLAVHYATSLAPGTEPGAKDIARLPKS